MNPRTVITNFSRFIFWLMMVGGMVATGLSVGSLAGFLPVADLFSHFRWQYAALLLVLSLVALLWKRKIFAGIFGVAAAFNTILVLTLWLPGSSSPAPLPKGRTLSILNMNLLFSNTRSDLVSAEIKKFHPDVIVMEELNENMLNECSSALADYPYRTYNARFDAWGIGIFSKQKLENVRPNALNLETSYVASADVAVGERKVTILGIHTVPELSFYAVGLDKGIIEGLTAFNNNSKNQIIMIGDFNATPWSNFFRQLIGTGHLIDSEQGFGMQPSWPTGVPFLRIPIDHCVCSPDFKVTVRRLGDFVGSDHFPVYLQITVPTK